MLGFTFFADQTDASRQPPARPELPTPRPQPNGEEAKLKSQTQGPAEPPDDQEEETSGIKDEAGEALALVLPWMTSFLVHVGMAIIALFVTWAVITEPEKEEEVHIVPIARLSANPGGQVSDSQQQTDLAATQNTRQVESQSVSTSDSVESLNTDTADQLDLVGATGGGGGALATFGNTQGAAVGGGAKFYGAGGNARKIIYCVDASGSLIAGMPFVIKELKKSIGELTDKQEFTVIFFQDGEPIEPPPRGWKVANSDNKRAVLDWMTHDTGNLIAGGKTDPVKAIRVAMNYKPELLFILSDNITGLGKYEIDRAELLGFLSDSNKPDAKGELRTKINAIQFITPDSLDTLKEIAEQNGGIYKFVTEKDLGLSSK